MRYGLVEECLIPPSVYQGVNVLVAQARHITPVFFLALERIFLLFWSAGLSNKVNFKLIE